MQTIHITTPLFSIDISAEHERDIIRKAAFWLSLPHKCPKCESPLILSYRTPKTFKYYELKCTGTPAHSVNLGVSQNDSQDLYYDPRKSWNDYRAGAIDDVQPADNEPAPNPGPSTPNPASPPAEPKPISKETADLNKQRNEVIQLIAECKSKNIDPKLWPADVGKLDPKDLEANYFRLNNLVAGGQI